MIVQIEMECDAEDQLTEKQVDELAETVAKHVLPIRDVPQNLRLRLNRVLINGKPRPYDEV